MNQRPRAILFWLEPAPPGSAANTHLNGTQTRLQAGGYEPVVIYSPEPSAAGRFAKLWRILLLSTSVFTKTRRRDVILTRWHPLTGLSTPLLRRMGRSVVLLVQGNSATGLELYPWFGRLPGAHRLIRAGLRSADHVFVLNEGLARWVRTQMPDSGPVPPIEVLPTGVSDVFFEPHTAEPSSGEDPYVLFFGNLAPWQGLSVLLEATRTPSWPAGVRLVVVGDGAEAHLLEGADPARVEWLGKLGPEALAPLVAGALCTVCPKLNTPSMAETTTPFKVLESVAAGVPVVVSDIPAQRIMIEEGGYGLLFTDGPKGLAEAVRRLVTDHSLRNEMSVAARAAAPQFRWLAAAPPLTTAVRRLAERR